LAGLRQIQVKKPGMWANSTQIQFLKQKMQKFNLPDWRLAKLAASARSRSSKAKFKKTESAKI
jgi:hypothetical protein